MKYANEAIDRAIAILRHQSTRRDYHNNDAELRQIASFSWPTNYDGGRFLVSLDQYEKPAEAGDKPVATITWEFGTFSKYKIILAECWLDRTMNDPACDKLVWKARSAAWVNSWDKDDVE